MATKFTELKAKILRGLGDVVNEDASPMAGNIFSAELLRDAVHAALKRVSTRVWKNSVMDTSETGTIFALPSDYIDIQGVFDKKTGVFLPRIEFSPGQVMTQSGNANAWLEFPGNSISFLNEIGEEGVSVYYMAHWALPLTDAADLECPEILVTACTLYAASYCLIRSAVESGDVAQFKTKVDSGKPTDIPAMQLSDWLLKRFESELSNIPMKQRS